MCLCCLEALLDTAVFLMWRIISAPYVKAASKKKPEFEDDTPDELKHKKKSKIEVEHEVLCYYRVHQKYPTGKAFLHHTIIKLMLINYCHQRKPVFGP
jgi:hypothetical protein